jgi:hypothetical protein
MPAVRGLAATVLRQATGITRRTRPLVGREEPDRVVVPAFAASHMPSIHYRAVVPARNWGSTGKAAQATHGLALPDIERGRDASRGVLHRAEPGDSVSLETLDCWWSAGPLAPGQDIPERPRAAGWTPRPVTR